MKSKMNIFTYTIHTAVLSFPILQRKLFLNEIKQAGNQIEYNLQGVTNMEIKAIYNYKQ